MREVIKYIVEYDGGLNKLLNLNNQFLRDLKIKYISDEEIVSKHEVENGYLTDSLINQYKGFFLKFDFIDKKKNGITYNIKIFFKIVEIVNDDENYKNKAEVVFELGEFIFYVIEGKENKITGEHFNVFMTYNDTLKVVGNIHDRDFK